MGKGKKLSKKQHTLIEQNTKERIETLISQKIPKGLVISHMGYSVIVELEDQSLVSCKWRQHLGSICVGDYVLVEINSNHAQIEAVLPRTNVIAKPTLHRGIREFVANIDQMLVVIATEPKFSPSLIDRYIITGNYNKVPCIIFLNKIDLTIESSIQEEIDECRQIYNSLDNVIWLEGSTVTNVGIDELTAQLKSKKTAITGQSGVGKSTLIKTLIPTVSIQTKSISETSKLGRHSTTNSTLYHLDGDTCLIDTPGVRSFNIHHYDKEAILAGYTEISPLIGYCQFSNCSHKNEPQCAILSAVDQGDVSKMRYQQFIQILSEID